MKRTIFYSWQSDTKAAANRTLIQDELEKAARAIAADESIDVEPVIERDTANVPGSPDIGATILKKIREAAVVVADVTIINQGLGGRPTPNPNVLIEVGYALATHSESRLILVQNTAFGPPESLPFDLRQKRVLSYESSVENTDRASPRRRLEAALENAIASVLKHAPATPSRAFPIDLDVGYKKKASDGALHQYELRVTLKNVGTKRISQWNVTIDMPRPLMTKEQTRHEVRERSTKERVVFRFDEASSGIMYPEDVKVLKQEYRVDEDLYMREGHVLLDVIKVRAYVEGELGASVDRPVSELHEF
jgi:hypothetical protein